MFLSFYLCYCKVGFTYMDGAGVGYVSQLCLKQGDQVILNLVFILETVIRIKIKICINQTDVNTTMISHLFNP